MLVADISESRRRQVEGLRDFMVAYAGRRPVRKVAMVGNAPLMASAERAETLDSCDLVIRANSLVLDEPGDPPCMGRTCHAVLLSRSTRFTPWVFQDYRNRAYLVMQAGFTTFGRTRDNAEHWPADLGAMPVPNEVITRSIADRLDPVREPGSVIPTTGTTGLFLAHELFPDAEMVATGFSFLKDHTQTEWDHHSGGRTAVNEKHKLSLEAALLESWIDDGSMKLLD